MTAVRMTANFLGENLKVAECEDACEVTLTDGELKLTTVPAICLHLAQKEPQHHLLGRSEQEEAQVKEYAALFSKLGELIKGAVCVLFCPKLQESFEASAQQAAFAQLKEELKKLDAHLLDHTYLVGERPSLADVMIFAQVAKIFSKALTKDEAAVYGNLIRWANTIVALDEVKKVVKILSFAKETLPTAPVKALAPAEKKEQAVEAPKAPEPKYTFDMYAWKKHYKNLDWEGGAHWEPYFWEHYKPEEFTMFLCTYMYPEYLTEGLKAKNMIMIWLQKLRAEKCDVHSFGNVLVTKVESEPTYHVTAVFMFPGKEVPQAVLETMGSASYKWEALENPTDPETKQFISDVWNWKEDADIVYRGVNYGKTYDGETWH